MKTWSSTAWTHRRERHAEPILSAVIKGIVGGIAGTALLSAGMRLAPKVLQQLGVMASSPRGKQHGAGEPPTEKLAEEVAEGVFKTDLSEEAKAVAGQTIHWGYGAAWGALYGVGQHYLRLPHLLHGTVFGALVGLVASTLVPALRLTPPPTAQPLSKNIMQFALHLLYGWGTALTFHFLSDEG